MPTAPSDSCRILVEGAKYGTPKDKSKFFSIIPLPADTLITHLVFTTEPQTLSNLLISEAMRVQTRNASDEIVPVMNRNVTLNLSSSSGTGEFSLSASPFHAITATILADGYYESLFYYRDPTGGDFTLTVAESPDQNWLDATQIVHILDTTRIEAESMQLTEMQIITVAEASNGQVAEPAPPYGSATYYFFGASGDYQIFVGYYDQPDGTSEGLFKINDLTVADWFYDETPAGASAVWRQKQIAITPLAPNDKISIRIYPDGAESGWLDYVKFTLFDTIPPAMTLQVIDSCRIDIHYSEPVIGAADANHYAITPALGALTVVDLDSNRYRLVTEVAQAPNWPYLLKVSAVVDNGGNSLQPDSVEFIGYSSTGYPIRAEAEQMLLNRMQIETWEGRSRNQVIRVASGIFNSGNARCNFTGVAGNYRIAVAYYDENDGNSSAVIKKNGVNVASWTWNQTPVGGADTWRLFTSNSMAFSGNDQIIVQVTRNGGEAGYWDYLEFKSPGMAKNSDEALALPEQYQLYENYPNPFNPVTTIRFDLPVPQHVLLKIYNIKGQLVRTLVDDLWEAGFQAVTWDASTVATGLYFYEIQAGDFRKVRKMLLVK